MVDSDGARRDGHRGSKYTTGGDHGQSHSSRANGYGGSRSNGGGGAGGHGEGSGGGRRGRDGDDWNRRPSRTSVPAGSDSEDTSEEEDSSDDYGQDEPNTKIRPARGVSSPSGTDDDIPLAQKMPTALKAQRTIRRQIKDEREERKRARSLRRPGTADRSIPVSPLHITKALPLDRSIPPSPLPPLRPPVESISVGPRPAPPNIHELPRQSASAPVGRARTKTMPSQPTSPFSMGELTKKLLRVQTVSQSNGHGAPPTPSTSTHRQSHDAANVPLPRTPLGSKDAPAEYSHRTSAARSAQDGHVGMQQRLMHMRSFHRPRTATDEPAPPVPMAGADLQRSASKKHREAQSAVNSHLSREEERVSLDRARSTRSHSRRPSAEPSGRVSSDNARPPMPSLPSGEVFAGVTQTAYQQRVFISNLQRYCQVELTSTSTAHEVLELLQHQNALDGSASGWMIFEMCQDFGMERPIRSFEVLSDVTNSWIADKTTNVLMAKKTLLAPKLSRAAIPASSPTLGGFVQWEYKRGKWQKRWLELREHSLWISKRESGKDQTMLCSLNNFDAYAVTRVSKAPKGFVFAVKSTDSLSFFESTTDYVHVFSCDEKDGLKWLDSILLARSYVLHQDRNILSSTVVSAPVSSGGAALSRAGTRKRPAQPLVHFGQAAAVDAQSPPLPPGFEPGSLLAKRGI
ncbi:hypothetical protein BDW22DRAFT_1337212 [Trametopsis cervina]|nr:hypothetical protein BDW22DRAFT_1337212 [Trametopsis cervina]